MRSDVDIMLLSFKEEISNISITEDDRKLLEFLFILNNDSENMISNFRFFKLIKKTNFLFYWIFKFLANCRNFLKNHLRYHCRALNSFLKVMGRLKASLLFVEN